MMAEGRMKRPKISAVLIGDYQVYVKMVLPDIYSVFSSFSPAAPALSFSL
jgi:hypothetical protein